VSRYWRIAFALTRVARPSESASTILVEARKAMVEARLSMGFACVAIANALISIGVLAML
jgi:hypothetical protein